MKVVITDYGYENISQEEEIIRNFGAELVTGQCKTEDEVIACASDADALICQFAPITSKVIDNLERCKVIVRYAVGVDNIDVKAAEAKGIHVCNVPDYGAEEVSNHALTLILMSVRKTIPMTTAVKDGKWSYTEVKPIHRLSTLSLGLFGFGRIPRLIAKKALCFGLRVLVYDPYVDAAEVESAGCSSVAFTDLLSESDLISIHAPLTEKTHHTFNRDSFMKMRKKPYLINTARGGLVDEVALLEALENDLIAGAALDVSETEPMDPSHKLLHRDDVLVTPHSAWYSEESIGILQRSVAEEAVRVLSGSSPKNPVNNVK